MEIRIGRLRDDDLARDRWIGVGANAATRVPKDRSRRIFCILLKV
jgi:hypothetical protein